MNPSNKARGFTLLELLLAVFILAVIGSAAYKLLAYGSDAIEYARDTEQDIQSLVLLQWILRQDLHGISRPHTSAPLDRNRKQTPLLFVDNSHPTSLSMVRASGTSLLRDNSGVIRYALAGPIPNEVGELYQLTRQSRVTEDYSTASAQDLVLIKNVKNLSVRVTDVSGKALLHWPDSSTEATSSGRYITVNEMIPERIQFELETTSFGKIPIVVSLR